MRKLITIIILLTALTGCNIDIEPEITNAHFEGLTVVAPADMDISVSVYTHDRIYVVGSLDGTFGQAGTVARPIVMPVCSGQLIIEITPASVPVTWMGIAGPVKNNNEKNNNEKNNNEKNNDEKHDYKTHELDTIAR